MFRNLPPAAGRKAESFFERGMGGIYKDAFYRGLNQPDRPESGDTEGELLSVFSAVRRCEDMFI